MGVDEVGRGPLAGPVVAAAAVFPAGVTPLAGVRDSKTLSPRQRAVLVPQLFGQAVGLAVAAASVREIDRFNIRVATAIAMRRAIDRVLRRIGPGASPHRVLLDGLPLPECGHVHDALVDGDALCYSIAAAGIVAKEVRDHLMRRLARHYPGYDWESNAGYATDSHRRAIFARGPTPHHRRSFSPVAQMDLHLA
ncbi:MAG: ribonuclease HII [Gemmatimonadota bacterium]|nr:ribonuclease HII [Gemmatimonadota bacterium]